MLARAAELRRMAARYAEKALAEPDRRAHWEALAAEYRERAEATERRAAVAGANP
jgi:hypothetical protein